MSDLQTIKLDSVHEELLDNISDSYQKTEGFPTWDLLRAAAYGLKTLWDRALEVEWKQDVDNLSDDELTKLVYQRTGLERNAAVKATGAIKIVTGAGYIIAGDLFATESGIQFQSLESKTVTAGNTVSIQAVTGGTEGNVASGTITQMPVTIAGISQITNEDPLTGGYDEETDTELRVRYYEYLQTPATCGNKYHYLLWAKEVDGVGAAKCIPCWEGKNTVKVIITGNDSLPASDTLVASVQEYIDPNKAGEGTGQAPIGAVCTVVAADTLTIDVSVTVSIGSGESLDDITELIKTALDTYIKSLVFNKDYVSYAKIGAAILDIEGVLDYSDLKVNNQTGNIEIAFAECPVLGEVTVS